MTTYDTEEKQKRRGVFSIEVYDFRVLLVEGCLVHLGTKIKTASQGSQVDPCQRNL
jgi:hypothetical protein